MLRKSIMVTAKSPDLPAVGTTRQSIASAIFIPTEAYLRPSYSLGMIGGTAGLLLPCVVFR